MEDLFGIVVVLLIYLAVVGSFRKGARRKRGEKKRVRREPQFEAAFEEKDKGRATGAEQVSLEDVRQALAQAARSAAPESAASHQEPNCRTRPLHLHEPTQEEMDAAQEGEDPCHGGYAPQMPAEAEANLFGEETDAQTLSQDVLRGVVMSEILTRPCERRKRGTYGR